MNFTRLGRAPVVSVDHLMGIVRAPPAARRRARAARSCACSPSGVHDGALRTLGPLTERDDALAAIRASMAIPVWSGPAVAYRGELLSDGGLIESIPVATPLAEGATHVIALRSRDSAYRKGRRGRLYGVAEDLVGSRLPGELPRLIAERPARYDAEADALAAATRGRGRARGPRHAARAPRPGAPLVGRLQIDRDRVRAVVRAGGGSSPDALAAQPADAALSAPRRRSRGARRRTARGGPEAARAARPRRARGASPGACARRARRGRGAPR